MKACWSVHTHGMWGRAFNVEGNIALPPGHHLIIWKQMRGGWGYL